MAKRTVQGSDEIRTRPLVAADWPILERLFGPNGACGGCWCMYWRLPRGGKLWEERKGAKNKAAFRRLVKAGKVHGCLAFCGEEPVGWCCVGPRADFPRLERTKALAIEWNESTWSVVCFYIRSGWRGQGVASALLAEAVAVAQAQGARTLEGYPVKVKDDGSLTPAAFAWTGVPRLFEKARFRDVAPEGSSRPIYQRSFRQPRGRAGEG